MNDKQVLYTRYPDLFDADEGADPALVWVLDELETIYPPVTYPASLPERIRFTLKAHPEVLETTLIDRPSSKNLQYPQVPKARSARPAKRWQHGLNKFAAAVLALLLVSLLVLVLQQSRHVSQIGANMPNTASSSKFLGVVMTDHTNGWAKAASSVLHTTDGGIHWQDVTPPHLQMMASGEDLWFDPLTATTAWLSTGEENALLHTIDSGRTWQQVALPQGAVNTFFTFRFANDRLGWISLQANGKNTCWYTKDGGQTWQSFTIPLALTQFGRLTFFDEKTWALTTGAADSSTKITQNGRPMIYVTHTAGTTWQQQVLPVPMGLSFSDPMENLQAFSATDGVLSVMDGGEDILVYTTHDGGNHWQFTAPLSPDIIRRHYELGLPAFTDTNHGTIYVGPIPVYGSLPDSNYLITTSDAGRHWQVITVSLPLIQQSRPGFHDSAQVECDFVSPEVGWLSVYYAPSKAGLPANGLYKTVDGGHTWTLVLDHIASGHSY